MNYSIFVIYWDDDVDQAELVDQLAEINAIPGAAVVPLPIPSAPQLRDGVAE